MNNLLEEEELIALIVCVVLMMFPNYGLLLAYRYWLSLISSATIHSRETVGKKNRERSFCLPSLELLEEEDDDDDDESRSNCQDSNYDYGANSDGDGTINSNRSRHSTNSSIDSLLSNDIFDEADSISLTRKRFPQRETCEIKEKACHELKEEEVLDAQSEEGGTATPNTSTTLATMTDTKTTLHNDNTRRMEQITARIKPKLLYRRICCSKTATGRGLPTPPLVYAHNKYTTNQQISQHRMRGSKTSTSIGNNNNKHNSRRSSKTVVIVVSFGEDIE